MSTVILVVENVVAHQAPQMYFVERNDMIQQFAPTTSNPELGNSILPRRPDADSPWSQARRLQEGEDIRAEFGVTIQNHVTMAASLSEIRRQITIRASQIAAFRRPQR